MTPGAACNRDIGNRTIGDKEIGDELEHVVASSAFRSAPRLAAFLRFVVEMTLAGQSDRIKGYTIGVEALGRDESFDPQTDPIVRVEAGRLRRALARHYAGAGRNDAVVIELPLGRYVPAFHSRPGSADAAAAGYEATRARADAHDLWLQTTALRAAAREAFAVHQQQMARLAAQIGVTRMLIASVREHVLAADGEPSRTPPPLSTVPSETSDAQGRPHGRKARHD